MVFAIESKESGSWQERDVHHRLRRAAGSDFRESDEEAIYGQAGRIKGARKGCLGAIDHLGVTSDHRGAVTPQADVAGRQERKWEPAGAVGTEACFSTGFPLCPVVG